MNTPDDAKISRLPAWAQAHILTLTRQRDDATRALNRFCDNQTPTGVSHLEWVMTGESSGPSNKRHYVQAREVIFENAGVALTVRLLDDQIWIDWDGVKRVMAEIAFIPSSFQQARLVAWIGE